MAAISELYGTASPFDENQLPFVQDAAVFP
jgi:hypothetical protein